MTNGEPRTALQPDGGGGGARCITFVDWWAVKKTQYNPVRTKPRRAMPESSNENPVKLGNKNKSKVFGTRMAFKKAKREQENSVISKGNSVSPDGRRTTRSRRQKRIAKHASDGFFLISCFVFMFHFHFFFVFVSFRVLFRSGGFRSISFFFPIGSPSFFLFIFFGFSF